MGLNRKIEIWWNFLGNSYTPGIRGLQFLEVDELMETIFSGLYRFVL